MFTLGAADTAMILVAPSAAAVGTTTTLSVQGTVATTGPVALTANVAPANATGTVEFN
ncbi:hypothetical protein [Rhodococcus opacus]|uniref:hypothetical protein n=1 Tax=Rhodococcus opacus TaxID=37919 RepID=UPI002954ADE6|nr:hypothetical protein [Rhodococcus opacus]MDV7084079.1 hypothetical protein [Rhodococcus opacus]